MILRSLAAFALIAACTAPASAQTLLERGNYLMNSVAACGNCHTPQTEDGPEPGLELAGSFVIEIPGVFTAYAPNITPDEATGIGSWSDEEIMTAIREGKRPDGSVIGPPMEIELYRDISDNDVRAIVAYLRSVPAVSNEVPASTYEFPLPPAYGPPVGSVPDPDRTDKVAYGKYLVGPVGHCIACHTPVVNGRVDYANQLGAGGRELDGPWGHSVTANITPHEDGIAGYSDEDIKRAITQGIAPGGRQLLAPMAFHYYRNIQDEDLDAIVAYLRTLEPKPSP